MTSLDLAIRCACAVAATLTLSPTPAAQGAPTTVPGFAARAGVDLPASAKGWIGLDRLPSGDLVSFDGQALVTLDAGTGAVKAKLVSLPSAVFGSSVRVGPTGEVVFFSESSTGAIYRFDLARKQLTKLTTITGNFALAFHPWEGERFLYVSARPGFTGTAKVFRVDTRTAASDLIAEAVGFAGPIVFDSHGDLYFAPAPLQFGKKGKAKILRFAAADVLSAIGPGHLAESRATLYSNKLDNVFDLAFDSEHTLYATDSTFGTTSLLEIRPGAGAANNVLTDLTTTFLAFAGGKPPFERFGRAGATLYILSTDFGQHTRVVALSPKRPRTDQTPSNPLPKGTKVSYRTTGCPSNAFAISLIGAGLVPERPILPLGAGGLAFPSFGVVLTAPFLLLPAKTDASGQVTLTLATPSTIAMTWTAQVLAGPVQGLPGGAQPSPWVTSNPVRTETR